MGYTIELKLYIHWLGQIAKEAKAPSPSKCSTSNNSDKMTKD